MSTRATWTYVAISIALLVGYVYTGTLEGTAQRAAFKSRLIFDFEQTSITRLSIDTDKHDLFEATRVGTADWVMSDPYAHVVANGPVWEELTKVVTRLTNDMEIEKSPEDLSIYGLEDPLLKVGIETDAKELIQLNVGDLDPTQNNCYAQRIGDDTVFLIPARIVGYLYRSLKDVRNVWVFPGVDPNSIDKIEFTRYPSDDPDDTLAVTEGVKETYEVGGTQQWNITAPITVPANYQHVQNLLISAINLKADGFIDSPESLGDYGLKPAWAKISFIDSKSGTKRTMRLGWRDEMAADGRWYATLEGNPTVFTIDAAFIAMLPDKPDVFRERRLFSKKATHLSAIHYKDTNREFHLVNDETKGWRLSDPAFDDTDQRIVNAYISVLILRMVGTDFVEASEMSALDSERVTLSFDFSDGSPSTSFALGGLVPDSDPLMLYARQDSGSIMTLPFRAYDALRATTFTFRNKHLFAFEQAAVTEVSMTLEGTNYALKRDAGVWSVVKPEGYQIESQSDMDALSKTLAGYLVIDVADPAPAADITGSESPVLEVTVTYATPNNPKATKSLRVGNLVMEGGRDRFSWIEGRDETFFVDQGFIDDIRREIQGIRPNN